MNTLHIEHLATCFSRQLRTALTPDQLAAAVLDNANEQHSGVCHTHDHVDANEVMADAWVQAFPQTEFDMQNDEHCQLWSEAWNVAKQGMFSTRKIDVLLPLLSGMETNEVITTREVARRLSLTMREAYQVLSIAEHDGLLSKYGYRVRDGWEDPAHTSRKCDSLGWQVNN